MTGLLFVVLLLAGLPVALVLLATTLSFGIIDGNFRLLQALPQIAFGSVETFDLLAIPLFILLGEILNEGGLTRRIMSTARVALRRMPHDLPLVNLVANLFLAAIMGSATAQMAIMTRVGVPQMERAGYNRGYSTALTVSAGLLGPIIPPSMPFIIYGVLAQVSIADMFRAGIIPGLLLFALLVAIALMRAGKARTEPIQEDGVQTGWRAALPGLATLLIPGVIVGGISFGIFTPTESAAVAVFVAILLGAGLFRELTLASVPAILDRTIGNTGIVLFLIAAAKMFGWVLTYNQIPQAVAAFITTLTSDPTMFMLLIVAALVVVGMLLDGIAALIILVPILLPVATGTYGIEPVHFGVVMSLTLILGLLTPPVGAGLYIAAAMSGTNIIFLFRQVFPYLVAAVAVIVLVILLPAILLMPG